MSGITLGAIHYNPRTASFEAPVSIHTEGRTFRYPCAVRARLNMDPGAVQSALIADAQRKANGPTRLRAVL